MLVGSWVFIALSVDIIHSFLVTILSDSWRILDMSLSILFLIDLHL